MAGLNRETRVILFISLTGLVFSLETARAEEAMAPAGLQAASKVEYKSEDARDPFEEEKTEDKGQSKQQAEAKPLPNLQIQGIVWGGGLPQAIINNKVMRVGDTIEGVQITDINKKGVTVFFDSRRYTLSTSLPGTSQSPKHTNP